MIFNTRISLCIVSSLLFNGVSIESKIVGDIGAYNWKEQSMSQSPVSTRVHSIQILYKYI